MINCVYGDCSATAEQNLALLLLLAGLLITALGLASIALYYRSQPARPRPDRAELAERRRQRDYDRDFFRAVAREAKWLAKEIPEQLATQNKLAYVYRDYPHGRRGRRKKNKLRFEAILLTRTEIWFRFNGRRLPYGVSFADILNPNNQVADNLQFGIGRTCRLFTDNQYNVFLRVGLKNSLLGIPKRVAWADVVQKLPAGNNYAVAIGINEFNRVIYQDITKWPHALVMGGTNMGKSTALKQMLITLISRNTPARLQLALIDLKRVELAEFSDIPHTIHHADRPEAALEVLHALEKEMDHRLDQFVGVANDITGWNAQRPNHRMSRILLIIDELATITTDRHIRGAATDSLINLARLGRAAGIHLMLCTQVVSKHVLPMDVIANIEGRLCFGVANTSASILAIGNGLAVTISHPGRAVYIDDRNHTFVQSPIAEDADIMRTLAIARGDIQPASDDETPADDVELALFKVAYYNLGGAADWRSLYDSTDGTVGQRRIQRILAQYEYTPDDPKIITIDDEGQFILAPGFFTNNGRAPRRLIPVNGTLPSKEEAIEQARMAHNASRADILEESPDE